MLRRKIAAFLSTLVLSMPALGAPPGKETPPAPASPADHLKRAEQARKARRWDDVLAYWLAPPVAGIFGIGMVAPIADRKATAGPVSVIARRAN